jgi:hypothetical protein
MKVIHSVLVLAGLYIFTSAKAKAQINAYLECSPTSIIVPVQPKTNQHKTLVSPLANLFNSPEDSVRYVRR